MLICVPGQGSVVWFNIQLKGKSMMLDTMHCIALGKQGDKALSSVRLYVCLSVYMHSPV